MADTIYDWFNIFNYAEFDATGLVQRTLTPILQDYGQKTILVTKGNEISVQVDDIFLPVEFFDENPYEQDGYAVYRDNDDEVWIGFEVE